MLENFLLMVSLGLSSSRTHEITQAECTGELIMPVQEAMTQDIPEAAEILWKAIYGGA